MNGKIGKQFCVHGHDTFICGRTKRGLCNICNKDIKRTWYQKNRDRLNIKRNQIYEITRDKILKINRNLPDSTFYRNRNAKLVRNFGITLEDYNKMFEHQKGKCILCNKHQSELNRDLSVDHDHKTGRVRGLLCDPCNRALGLFRDDIKTLKNAVKYLS